MTVIIIGMSCALPRTFQPSLPVWLLGKFHKFICCTMLCGTHYLVDVLYWLSHVVEFLDGLGWLNLRIYLFDASLTFCFTAFWVFLAPYLGRSQLGKLKGMGKLGGEYPRSLPRATFLTLLLNQTSEHSVFFFSSWVTSKVYVKWYICSDMRDKARPEIWNQIIKMTMPS